MSAATRASTCHHCDDVLLLSLQAVQRAQLVGWRILQQQQQQPQPTAQQQQHLPLPDSFPEQCAWLMDRVLLEHLDVCFGQAMSVVVACVVYVAAKLLQASVTFKLVTEVGERPACLACVELVYVLADMCRGNGCICAVPALVQNCRITRYHSTTYNCLTHVIVAVFTATCCFCSCFCCCCC